jgi:hypothetical protein
LNCPDQALLKRDTRFCNLPVSENLFFEKGKMKSVRNFDSLPVKTTDFNSKESEKNPEVGMPVKIRVLVAIANYGTKNIEYIKRLIQEYRSMHLLLI